MEQVTVLLVEDNFLNRRLVKKILQANGFQIMEAADAGGAIDILEKHAIHLVILDINLGADDEDGIWVGNKIKEQYKLPFIYLTAFETNEIISKAAQTLPLSYLTKPFKDVDLLAAIKLALLQVQNQVPQIPAILVRDEDFFLELPIHLIDYIESVGNYLQVYSEGKIYKCRSTLSNIMKLLPAPSFVQTHRAYVVNKEKIEKFDTKQLVVQSMVIPISKMYRDTLTATLTKPTMPR